MIRIPPCQKELKEWNRGLRNWKTILILREGIKLPKVTYACIDCGKERTARESDFGKPREEYRCASCTKIALWADPTYRKSMSEKIKHAWEDPNLLKWRANKTIELWNDPEYRNKTISGINDPEVILRLREQYYDNPDYKLELSERVKQLWENPEYAIKMRESMKTKEAKSNRSKASKITWSNPDLISMRSLDSKRRWDDPVERQKILNLLMEAQNRPEIKEKKRRDMIQSWADPLSRMKRLDTIPRGENHSLFGKHLPESTKEKLRIANSGENSAMWKGGTSFQSYCPKFNERRKRAVRDFFSNICICCGKTVFENINKNKQYELSVHHIDHDKEQGCDGKPFNLVPLCSTCHTKEICREEEYKKYINKTLDEGFKWGIWDRKEYELKVMYSE